MVLKLFKEVLKVGDATLQYPFVPAEVSEGFRGRPQHVPELCMACAACAVACPSNALTMLTDTDQGIITWSIFYGRCIYCGRCEEVCPTGAIRLSREFELAVMNKAVSLRTGGLLVGSLQSMWDFLCSGQRIGVCGHLVGTSWPIGRRT